MNEGIGGFSEFEDCSVSAHTRLSAGTAATPDQGDGTNQEKSEDVSSLVTNRWELQTTCATTTVLSTNASNMYVRPTKTKTNCGALCAGGDFSPNVTKTSATSVSTLASEVCVATMDVPSHVKSDESAQVSSYSGVTADVTSINTNEVKPSYEHDHALRGSTSAFGCNVDHVHDEIKVLLEDTINTVVRREQIKQCDNIEKDDDDVIAAAKLQVEPVGQDQLCDKDQYTYYNSDAEYDFTEFNVPPGDTSASQCVAVLEKGDTVDNQKSTEDIQNDDDFGDFDQAAFDGEQSKGFANFEASPAPLVFIGSDSLEDVRPFTVDVFRATISKLFTAEDTANQTEQNERKRHLVTDDADYAVFSASVQENVCRCENVDDWPCVIFRYENSVTRKGLLNALCIDETPTNCPRFAIDCLSKAFLQPVKQTGSSMKGSHGPSLGSNPAGGTDIGGKGKLSDSAKEVLNKIPDLSFMKAEVLTFPVAGHAPLSIDLYNPEAHRQNKAALDTQIIYQQREKGEQDRLSGD
ncbi:hypothetical protein BIW11_04793 [Tropilaelaps mercedesae]|uniref:Uncharacterized protein n=1 Tax=Tropilaelaps mercedesae TaxID=418985 RepID=A0A1V9X1C7_9ACAR|nr:hypothetical protein BIW11_04793 [Tropilaelaps mercedesae]